MFSETYFSVLFNCDSYTEAKPSTAQLAVHQPPRHHQPERLVVIELNPPPPQKSVRVEAMSD